MAYRVYWKLMSRSPSVKRFVHLRTAKSLATKLEANGFIVEIHKE